MVRLIVARSRRASRRPRGRGLIVAALIVCATAGLASTAAAAGIEGLVYDAATATRAGGVSLRLVYDDTDPLSPGAPVPAGLLGPGQQGQIPGTDGRYRFDVQPGRRYRIEVSVGGTSFSFPSRAHPPEPGLATAGLISESAGPPAPDGRRYFLRFDVVAAGDEIANNHLPLDRLSAAIGFTKTASRARAEVGDVITYRIVVTNASRRDLAGEGRRLFVRDAPPRGFDLAAGAAVRVESGGQVNTAPVSVSREGPTNRILRFGPVELPRRGRLILEYRMVVGVDTRPGKSLNRAVLVDGGGVALSAEVAAAVEVSRPRGLESSVILGRVFCDRDGDGRFERGETGMFGARVYLDTGSYAVTDANGLYHFTRVDPGARLVKIDAATLVGSALRGDPRRLLQITPGLGAAANFPVDCRAVEIAGSDPRAMLRHQKRPSAPRPGAAGDRRVEIAGELVLLGLSIDGKRVELPKATVLLAAPVSLRLPSTAGINLAPVPRGGYGVDRPVFELGWSAPDRIAARRWELAIDEIDGGGAATPFLRVSGAGAPPASVAWDGRGDRGDPARPDRLYVAHLTVQGSRAGVEAASIRVPFGVGRGGAAAPIAETWTGALFAGAPTRPIATAELAAKVDALAPRLNTGDAVEVRVHGDGTGDALAAIAASQRRAEQIKSLLEARGVDGAAIDARGRGNAEPVGAPAQNLRVEVAVQRAAAPAAAEIPATLPVPTAAAIDGAPVAVDARGQFRWTGSAPPRGAVRIELRAQDGRRAALEVPIAGARQPRPRSVAGAVTAAELAASAAADFTVELPPAGTILGVGEIAVRGRARPGNRLAVNGVAVVVPASGRFAAVIPVPVDTTELAITSRDADGFIAEIRWPIAVDRRQLFAMALGEVAASTSITRRGLFADTAYLPTMSPDTTAVIGPLLLHGRVSAYLKGELDAGDFFGRVKLTAHVDTARRAADRGFFEDVHDPTEDPPVLGDSAVEVRDANGRGVVYAQIEARGSKAIVGALAVELGGGRLFRYGRTVDGGAARLREELGDHRIELDAFGTASTTEVRRDHLWYRSTGGTVYFLRFARVVEGSELVRAVVLDRDSGQPISERVLHRTVDYTVDYDAGRLWMIEPLPHAEPSLWVLDNSESAVTPAGGNPVYLDVRYEHRDTAPGPGDRAGGVEARYRYKGAVTAGVGLAGETRESAPDYELWGAHARFAHRDSAVTVEVAGSREQEGAVELSTDGGLTFRDLSAALDPDDRGEQQLAWRVGGDVRIGDFLGSGIFSGSRFRFYAQGIDPSFSTTSTALERGRLKLGLQTSTELGARDALVFRHQSEIAEVPRIGPTAAEVSGELGAVDERATYITSLQWRGARGRLAHQAELGHQRLTSTAPLDGGEPALDARRFGAGARVSYALTGRLTGQLSQQAWIAEGGADPLLEPLAPAGGRDSDPLAGLATGAGVSLQVLPDAAVIAEIEQRWNGDRSAAVGLRARLSELGSFYVAERARTGPGGPAAVSVIGAEDRFGPDGAGRSYGEYQIESSGLGVRNRAVLGLGRRWRVHPDAAVGFTYEHQATTGGFLPDGTPIGENQRDLVRGGVDLRLGDEVVAGAIAEIRRDRGLRGRDIDGALAESDPRVLGGGFADHGGVAPGAPLILPAGTATQLAGSAGLTWRAAEGTTLFGRARGVVTLRTDATEPAVRRPGFGELTGGLAFRSLLHDKLNLLMRYSYVLERRPGVDAVELSEGAGDAETRSHVVAALPIAELPLRLRLSGKLAYKRSVAAGGLAAGARADSALTLVRLGLRIAGGWDAAVEGRALWVIRDGARELRAGPLVEIGYWLGPFLRFGLGYNFSHFDDNELGDLTRDAHGVFVRVTGQM
jgi:uncharacterized repeat protein (TIGR01451 family)